MNTTTIGASHIPGLFERQTFRHRAELPALRAIPHEAMHDFLVPNPRPDLTDEPAAQPEYGERRHFIEPDSIFWSPESQAGDAA